MIYLTKINPAQNMARFYVLDVQRTLFGDWALVREWGRIGRAGQGRRVIFGTQEAAHTALALELKRRGKRGYI
ncbi:MAG: WGR domain-containing protein [Rhodomicrobium sp.]